MILQTPAQKWPEAGLYQTGFRLDELHGIDSVRGCTRATPGWAVCESGPKMEGLHESSGSKLGRMRLFPVWMLCTDMIRYDAMRCCTEVTPSWAGVRVVPVWMHLTILIPRSYAREVLGWAGLGCTRIQWFQVGRTARPGCTVRLPKSFSRLDCVHE